MSERIVNVHAQKYKGKKFRSTLEAETAKALDAMGIPYAYEEKKIELLEGFRSPFQKDKVRSINYIPDFTIGNIMLECKGFETPEWKIKKKLLFKWLKDNEPNTMFYQIHDAKKQLIQVLDKHLSDLGFSLEISSKATRSECSLSKVYNSFSEAIEDLNLQGKPLGAIIRSLTGKTQYVYGYKWTIVKN